MHLRCSGMGACGLGQWRNLSPLPFSLLVYASPVNEGFLQDVAESMRRLAGLVRPPPGACNLDVMSLQDNAESLDRLAAERNGASRRAESLAMSLAALREDCERLKQACA